MNGTGALVCCFFCKGAKEKDGGGVRLCVCFVRVCEGGGGGGGRGVYHIQRLTNLLYCQDLYKKKQNDD